MALESVLQNARIFETLPQSKINWKKTERVLQKLLGLKTKIERIEGYDVSNIQGQQATGSLVVFENGLPNKNEYRKFKIKIEGKPNDTAMLKEVLSRRLKHKEWSLPRIMLIDGGRGQLNTAIKTYRGRSPVSLRILALAKRHNELFIEGKKAPVLLKNLPSETANLLLRVRDEAHRFAIAYHKKIRAREWLK